jgi:membrane protein implicated in regulation of membrane protease activity
MDWFQDASYWHWWVLAVLLIILEIISPAIFFLWMGISAAVVGLLVLLMPSMAWELQVVLFAAFSVASVAIWRRYLNTHPIESDQPQLNRRGEQYVGRTFTLLEPIVNGQGKIMVDDSTWKISGDDCPEGTKVQVVGVDGVILEVKVEVS